MNKTVTQPHPYRTTFFIILLIIFLNTIIDSLNGANAIRMLDHHHHLLSASSSEEYRNLLFGILLGTGGFLHFFVTPILASFSDRFGRKSGLIVSLGFVLISSCLYIVGIKLHSYAIVLIGSLFGISGMIKCIVETATVDISNGAQRKLYLGFTTVVRTLAGSMAVIVGAYLASSRHVSWFSLCTPRYLGLILIITNIFVVLFLFKEPKHNYNQNKIKPTINIFRSWFDMCKESPQVIKPLAAFALFEFSFALACHDTPLFWHGFLHTSIGSMARYMAFNSAIMGFSLLIFFPIWLKKVPQKYQLSVPIVLLSLSYFFIVFFYTPADQWILKIPIDFFAPIAYAQLLALIPSSVSEDKHGVAMGFVHSITTLVWSSSALIMVPLNELSPHLPLAVTGIFVLFSCWMLKKRSKGMAQDSMSITTSA